MGYLEKYIHSEEKKVRVDPVPGLAMNKPLGLNFRALDLMKGKTGGIGVEIELEGRPLPNQGNLERVFIPEPFTIWQVKADGSLRDGGLEYVFSRPVELEDAEKLIREFYDVLGMMESNLNLSNRTSTHVHLNFYNSRINTATSFIVLWHIFEEILLEWCGEKRKNNHFCLPASQNSYNVEIWEALLNYGYYPEGRGAKYSALNILPLWNTGSMEVRCAPAFDNPEKLISWVRLVNGIKEYAFNNFRNPQSIAQAVSEQRPSLILRDICKFSNSEEILRDLFKMGVDDVRIDREGIEGFRRWQKIVFLLPWNDWIEQLIYIEPVEDPFQPQETSSKKLERAIRWEWVTATAEEEEEAQRTGSPLIGDDDDEI
jgi:hypothetical protein